MGGVLDVKAAFGKELRWLEGRAGHITLGSLRVDLLILARVLHHGLYICAGIYFVFVMVAIPLSRDMYL